MKKRETHSRLVQDLRELLQQPDAVISLTGIVVAALLAVLDLANVRDDLMLPAILAVLTTLATSQVVSQFEQIKRARSEDSIYRQMESVRNILEEMAVEVLTPRGVSAVLKRLGDLEPLEKRLEGAETVDISCSTCNALFSSYGWLIKKKWEEGCQIRILVAYNPDWDENSDLLTALVFNHQTHAPTGDVYKGQIEQGVKIFHELGLFTESTKGGNVEIRKLSYLPVCSYMIVNRQSPDALIKVEMYVTGRENWQRPHFFVSRRENKNWYEFFASQFETLWSFSTPFTYTAASNQSQP